MPFIGYVSSKCRRDDFGPFDSHLGGSLVSFPHIPCPPSLLVSCKSCQSKMKFLLQIYCPLENSVYHRSLYVFVCIKPSCQSSGQNWRVLRSQHVDSNVNVGDNEWNILEDSNSDSDEDDWGQIQLKSSTDKQHDMNISFYPGPFECYAIDVYEDTAKSCTDNESDDQEFIEEDDNTMAGAFTGSLQAHLESRTEYGCETIRYDWCGVPIYDGQLPRNLINSFVCSYCKSKCVFEAQLFSTINNSLKLMNTECNDGTEVPDSSWLLNITTVLIFSCRESCCDTQREWSEEYVYVQMQETLVGPCCVQETR